MVQDREAGGVQSAEVVLTLLRVLAEEGGSLPLSRLAVAARMPAAKAHRYVVSLIRAGFVEQAGRHGAYALGANALRVGLAALARLDVMDLAVSALADLRDEIDQTVLLAIWGDGGPTVVRWMEASHPVTVNVRIGSRMPLIRSATGQAFGAWLSWRVVEPVLKVEIASAAKSGIKDAATVSEARRQFDSVRRKGLATISDQMLAGVQAIGAPIFNLAGDLEAVMTVLGTNGSFDISVDGSAADALRRTTRGLSKRLGHRADDER